MPKVFWKTFWSPGGRMLPASEGLVLDSFPLVAHLLGQRAGDEVLDLLKKASRGETQLFMSVVNFGEVVYNVERRKGLRRAQEIIAAIQELPVVLEQVTQAHALLAARFKAQL